MPSEIANELRAEIAKILKRFQDCDIAAVRMSTVKKIDRLLNPEPEGFDIPVRRERPGYIALERANLDRLREASPGMDAVSAEIERHRNAGLRERPEPVQRMRDEDARSVL